MLVGVRIACVVSFCRLSTFPARAQTRRLRRRFGCCGWRAKGGLEVGALRGLTTSPWQAMWV